jgi:hypothetical protein
MSTFEKIQGIVANHLGVAEGEISPESHLHTTRPKR